MTTLFYKKDFTITQRPSITEYFIWKCPECGKENETSEWITDHTDKELTCRGCEKIFKWSFDEIPSHENQ